MADGTKFEGQVVINRIEIVEWLGPNDTKTGHALHEFLKALQESKLVPPTPVGPFQFVYSPVNSRAAFLAKLAEIAAGSTIEKLPILHIEAHGNEQGVGAQNAAGATEFVSWQEMAADVRKINTAVRNNLIVVGAACSGFTSLTIGLEEVEKPSAFYVAVGPDKKITDKELEAGFALFYSRLFQTLDADAAVDAANAALAGTLKKVTTETIFYGGVAAYISDSLSDEGIAATLRGYAAKGMNDVELSVAKKILIGSREPSTWESRYRTYMHCQHPENAARFKFKPDVLKKHADHLINEAKGKPTA